MGRPTWRESATVLQVILNGARPDDQDRDVMTELIGSNLIAREEQHKPCKLCGTPRVDISYWRVTAAGRLLVAALEDAQPSAPQSSGAHK